MVSIFPISENHDDEDGIRYLPRYLIFAYTDMRKGYFAG